MSATAILLDLLGAAALLLFGVRLIRGAAGGALGGSVRRILAAGAANRFSAVATGFAGTLVLQSSTATALIVASFVRQGFCAAAMAGAMMLGANVGTAVVARLVALDVGWLAPACVLAGVVLAGTGRTRWRAAGSALIGLGLMLLSLRLMHEAAGPVLAAPATAAVLASLSAAPVVALIVGGLLAVLSASSLAVVLLVSAFVAQGGVAPGLALALVLGANVGGAVTPLLATARDDATGRRLMVGNLIVRLSGALALMPVVDPAADLLASRVPAAGLAVDLHLAFNLALAAVALPLLGVAGWLARVLVPEPPAGADGPAHLVEPEANPVEVLAAAAREVLGVGDRVEVMLREAGTALRTDDPDLCARIAAMDDRVDRLVKAVKLNIAALERRDLSAGERARAHEIVAYAIDLEHVGDIVEKGLVALAAKRIAKRVRFSDDGFAEIEELHARTLAALRMAQTVFLSRDPALARSLVEAKVAVRALEQQSAARHLERLREGRRESLETSGLHIDTLRDLKRITAHLASVAVPILETRGELVSSRLAPGPIDGPTAALPGG